MSDRAFRIFFTFLYAIIVTWMHSENLSDPITMGGIVMGTAAACGLATLLPIWIRAKHAELAVLLEPHR